MSILTTQADRIYNTPNNAAYIDATFRSGEYIIQDTLDFVSGGVGKKLDNRWAMVAEVMSTGNMVLESIASPIEQAATFVRNHEKDQFLETYIPKHTVFYAVQIPSVETGKQIIAPVVRATDDAGNIITVKAVNSTDSNIIDTVTPTRAYVEMYDYSTVAGSYFNGTRTLPPNYLVDYKTNVGTIYFKYPSVIFVTVFGGETFFNQDDITQLGQVIITGTRENGAVYNESIEIISNGTFCTRFRYHDIQDVRVVNISPKSGVYVNIDTQGTLLDGVPVEHRSISFSDYDGVHFRVFYEVTQHEDASPYTSLSLVTYAPFTQEDVLAGIVATEKQISMVLNGSSGSSFVKAPYENVAIDQIRKVVWGYKNSVLSLFSLQVPLPPEAIMNKIASSTDPGVGLYCDTQFPLIEEDIIITPVVLGKDKRMRSAVISVFEYDKVNDKVNETIFDDIIGSTPRYTMPENAQQAFTLTDPGAYLFQIKAIYEDGTSSTGQLMIYVPLLSPVAEFDIEDTGFSTLFQNQTESIVEMSVAPDGAVHIYDTDNDALFVVRPVIDRYLFKPSDGRLIFPWKYESIEVNT